MKPIKIWRYQNAPQKYKDLSTHGGDEDWVGVVPEGQDIPFFMEVAPFTVCDYFEYEQENETVIISAHA